MATINRRYRASSRSKIALGSLRTQRLKRDFVEYSTLHGIVDLWKAKGCPLRFLWTTVFVSAVGAAFYGCYAIVNAYLQSPVVVSYFVYGNESLTLPDIIVCPLNRFNATFLKQYNLSHDLAQYLELSFPSPMIFPFQQNKFADIYFKMPEYESEMNSLLNKINKTFTEFIEEATDLDCTAIIAHHTIEKVDENGNKIGRMSCADFPTFRISSGKCFRLPGQKQEAPGFGYGTRAILSLPRSIFSPGVNQLPINGIAVKLANSVGKIDKTDKMKSAQGLDTDLALIPAGTYALLSLKATRYEFINDPPRYECLTDPDEAYSRVHCFDSCLTERPEETCGCSPAAVAAPEKPICSAFRYWKCFYEELVPIIGEINNTRLNTCREKCKPLCSYWQYTPTISYGSFPSPEFRTFVPDNDTWDQLHNNIILEIFYEHLEYTTIKHFPSMAPDSFIAQLGGQVSLWVGGSILTVIQLLVFLVQLLCLKLTCFESAKKKTMRSLSNREDSLSPVLKKRSSSADKVANGHLSCSSSCENRLPHLPESSNSFEALM